MAAQNMHRLVNMEVLDKYCMQLEFSDGLQKTVDIRPFLGLGITTELLAYENFRRVRIEAGGGLEWYNGFDFCPNALRELSSEEF